MTRYKQNCWEYMRCGREPGGSRVDEYGVCPAASDTSYDAINSGRCAGRFCWAVAGTLCNGKVQGHFAEKRDSCVNCDFYKRVQMEEGTANLRTKFLRFMTSSPDNFLFHGATYAHIPQGTRFIHQGEAGDRAYIIHRGACIEIVEKDGELYPIGHRGEGDVVGMISVLTGEARNFHVEAETDMDVWVIHKEQFQQISQSNPDLHEFLTEIVADRFDSKRPISERTIDKYLAVSIVGRGGHSIVYKGLHTNLNMPVAIKMLRHDQYMRPEFLESFHNEARFIARLNHENIIKVYDIVERYKTAFIIMEYLDGESLMDMLVRLKRIPPVPAGYFLFQACSALNYAHEQGIIHRDINPSNMIILKNDRLKLIDFGLACPFGAEDSHFGGTLPYMAPELIDGELPNQQTDIFALGVTAFEMITGTKPFPTEDTRLALKLQTSHDIPDPIRHVPDIPEKLRQFIITACNRDPAKRYQTIAQALLALQTYPYAMQAKYSEPDAPDRMRILYELDFNSCQKNAILKLIHEFNLRLKELDTRLTPVSFQETKSDHP